MWNQEKLKTLKTITWIVGFLKKKEQEAFNQVDMEMMKTMVCPNPVPGEIDVYVVGQKPHLSVAFEVWIEAPLMWTI